MASTRELRRRIRSTKNIGQITKAMQMVAATKMRRAQNQALNGRPYTGALNESLMRLLPSTTAEDSPLLSEGQGGTGAILLSTDKSLCGALNTNLFRAAQNFVKERGKVDFYTVGSKGRGFVVKSGKDLKADVENKEQISFRDAVTVAKLVSSSFLEKGIKECYLIYPHFVSTLRQEPVIVKILPVTVEAVDTKQISQDFLFEPGSKELLDYVLTHYVESKIFQALLETKASEHSARMMAMQNATDNAKDLVDDLTLSYNQIRQDSITKELLEITTAGAALE
jgi:F-type H+-transporting ATPase subunit gamma